MTHSAGAPHEADGHRAPWWTGRRGEWLVVVQVALMALVFLGPRAIGGWPASWMQFPLACRVVGWVLLAAGGGLLLTAILGLGSGLTPLPYPKEDGRLVQTGPYALVRHPMYGGGVLLAFGWALCTRSWLTLGYVAVLFVFLDVKSRREERWLVERYPGYAEYQRRVRRLLPFVY